MTYQRKRKSALLVPSYKLDDAGIIRRAREILAETPGFENVELTSSSFLDSSDLVRDILKSWTAKTKADPWVTEFAEGLRRLRDDYAEIVRKDPMIIYQPAHQASREFHQSTAYIRYFRAPNRISKTQSACADNYWVLTGQHPWRPRPPLPTSVAIVVVNFSKQAPSVYVPKYVEGEPANPISPIFPEGGKWFNHWDSRRYILKLACTACAEAGKALSCKHPKSELRLFSDVEGPLVLAGGQYGQIHFDEQISEAFYSESTERLKTVPNSGLIVTETPLGGKGFWTHKRLTMDLVRTKRMKPGTEQRMCSLHTLSQYDSGLFPKHEIDASRMTMTEQEAEARIFGKPASWAKTAVFDNRQIGEMLERATEPAHGNLYVKYKEPPKDEPDPKHFDEMVSNLDEVMKGLTEESIITFVENPAGKIQMWEPPQPNAQYIVGADVSQGILTSDASAAQVLKLTRRDGTLHFDQVCKFQGWVNSLPYAYVLMKLSLFYNQALIVPERRGPGDATIQRLKEIYCWTLFRDTTDPANAQAVFDPRFGIDTNVKTKGAIISMLQHAIWDAQRQQRSINIRSRDTLDELGTYAQEMSQSKKSIVFRGESGMPDDEVMALAVGVYAALSSPIYDFDLDNKRRAEELHTLQNLTENEKRMWDAMRREEKLQRLAEKGLI